MTPDAAPEASLPLPDPSPEGKKDCPSCGTSAESWSHVCPSCGFDWDDAKGQEEARLWNPMAVAGWSLLFSPLFGAILLDRNWQALGEKEAARWSRLLMWGSAIALGIGFASALFHMSKPAEKAVTGMGKIVGLCLTSACFSIGRAQKRFLKESGKLGYPKQPWGKALVIGSAGISLFIGLLVTWALLTPPALEDVALDTQRAMADFFKNSPQYQVSTVNSVRMERNQGHDYFGTTELCVNGTMVQQKLHVHLEGGQLRWDTQTPGSTPQTQ